MRFDFKKIASVLASAVMLGSTAGMALAANYPAPMVVGGAADGAIVVTSGNHAGSQIDFWAAIDLQSALQGIVTSTKGTTPGSVSGEAYPLFTSGTKIYYNDTITKVKSILTDNELPTILADGSFEGKTSADFTQTIKLASSATSNYVTFAKQPTGDEDPAIGLKLSTTRGLDLYNLSVSFDRAENFTHTDSEGESLTLFGQRFTVGTDTDDDDLYLYKSSQTFSLSVGGSAPNPSQTFNVEGKEYTVELTAATDTSATVRVTNAEGKTDLKEINEADSKKILDIEVAINIADESTATNTISAEITVGAQKIKLTEGNEVKIGSDETVIEGTYVNFKGGGSPHNLTELIIQVRAEDSNSDAIIPGQSFVDPVFGTFKIDFAGINIPEDSTARDIFEVKTTDNTATLKMKTHTEDEGVITWYHNKSAPADLADSNGHYIHVREMDKANESEYIVVGNEDEGHLLQVTDISNSTGTAGSPHTDDKVTFKDVFSGKEYSTTITSEGQGSVTIGGKQYDVYYYADKVNLASDAFQVQLNYPDSTTAAEEMIIFPTIETSKGAKVAFYRPQAFNLSNWDGRRAATAVNLTKIRFPDGDGYQDLDIAAGANETIANWTLSGTGVAVPAGGWGNASLATSSTSINVSQRSNGYVLSYNITTQTALANYLGNANEGYMQIYLLDPSDRLGNVEKPALIIFEEEDDNNDIQALVVEMEGAGDSADEVGVNAVYTTWEKRKSSTSADIYQLETDDDLYKMVDLWGTYATIDKAESSQYTATISYPDEQIYAQIYAGEVGSIVSPDITTSGGGQILVVKDSEISTASGRNLVVVGGSCINSVAAKVLGVSSGTCGADFTAATQVGAGQYLIKSVQSPYNADKTAVLVAGYEAAETKSAVAKLKETHDTTVGTSKVYP